MLQPVTYPCAVVWISAGHLLCTCTVDHMYTEFRFSPNHPERKCCVIRGKSVYCNTESVQVIGSYLLAVTELFYLLFIIVT